MELSAGRRRIARTARRRRSARRCLGPGLESLKGVLARFLTAHSDSAAGPAFSLQETPGLAAALPAGVPVIEVLADLRPLAKLSETLADPKLHRILKALGTEQFGPVAYRVAMDENLLRSGFFLASAEPGTGILSLVDQPPLAAQPPAWVPAEVVSYAHLRFDLRKPSSRSRSRCWTKWATRCGRS